jgi:hypothetical protein
MSLTAIVGSLILILGSLILVWRGLDGVPASKLVRLALIWAVIILATVLLLRMAGV